MYSVDENYHQLMMAFKLGASGYIVKKFDSHYLKEFFHILAKGGAAISPEMAKKLINSIKEESQINTISKKLSEIELQILTFLAEGWTYQYIADKMNLPIDNIRYYIKKIYRAHL